MPPDGPDPAAAHRRPLPLPHPPLLLLLVLFPLATSLATTPSTLSALPAASTPHTALAPARGTAWVSFATPTPGSSRYQSPAVGLCADAQSGDCPAVVFGAVHVAPQTEVLVTRGRNASHPLVVYVTRLNAHLGLLECLDPACAAYNSTTTAWNCGTANAGPHLAADATTGLVSAVCVYHAIGGSSVNVVSCPSGDECSSSVVFSSAEVGFSAASVLSRPHGAHAFFSIKMSPSTIGGASECHTGYVRCRSPLCRGWSTTTVTTGPCLSAGAHVWTATRLIAVDDETGHLLSLSCPDDGDCVQHTRAFGSMAEGAYRCATTGQVHASADALPLFACQPVLDPSGELGSPILHVCLDPLCEQVSEGVELDTAAHGPAFAVLSDLPEAPPLVFFSQTTTAGFVAGTPADSLTPITVMRLEAFPMRERPVDPSLRASGSGDATAELVAGVLALTALVAIAAIGLRRRKRRKEEDPNYRSLQTRT